METHGTIELCKAVGLVIRLLENLRDAEVLRQEGLDEANWMVRPQMPVSLTMSWNALISRMERLSGSHFGGNEAHGQEKDIWNGLSDLLCNLP
jgi:hypothetical protein